jgi:hypothetical protein
MSTLFEISGEKRGRAILNAVHIVVAKEQRPTPESVHAELPEAMFKGFDADPPGEDEIAAAMELIEQQAAEHVASLEQPGETIREQTPDEPAQPEAPTLPPDEARENLRLANLTLANARTNLLACTNRRNAARGRLADAVAAWQSGLPRISRDQAVKEAIASYQATRAEQQRRPTPGPSMVDRIAASQRGGPAAWGNFRRGASTVRGGLNFDPRKGPVAKLPSQR